MLATSEHLTSLLSHQHARIIPQIRPTKFLLQPNMSLPEMEDGSEYICESCKL